MSEKDENKEQQEYKVATKEEVKKVMDKITEEHDELFRKLADS